MVQHSYWIWMQCALGVGVRLDEIIAYFGGAKQLYDAGAQAWRVSGTLTAVQVQKLSQTPLAVSAPVIQQCAKNNWTIITPESAKYPHRLRRLPDFPAVLYAYGDLDVLQEAVMLGIVGTRKASRYSLEATRRLSCELAKGGAVIVSGGALGVDSAAHSGALIGAGKTIAYLGCGFGTSYLASNEPLRMAVAQNGAVVTEFKPFTPAGRSTFPVRNRLISGSSLGVVVVEAGERSGSLITARLAGEQGRDVFAVPGGVISSAYSGTNKLIRDGAKPVFTAADVLEEYAALYPDKIRLAGMDLPLNEPRPIINDQRLGDVEPSGFASQPPKRVPQPAASKQSPKRPKAVPGHVQNDAHAAVMPQHLSSAAQTVYCALSGGALTADEITIHTGSAYMDVVAALTELELSGAVSCVSGKRYQILSHI